MLKGSQTCEDRKSTITKPDCDKYKIEEIHWQCKDVVTHLDGTVQTFESSNIVVSSISKLIAGLIGGKFASGVQYWAVGSGLSAWDLLDWTTVPPVPSVSAVTLNNEHFRKLIQLADISFVDALGNALPDNTPSNRLKIVASFGFDEGNGSWREFGLFGGNAIGTSGSGIMLDLKYHQLINKNETISVDRSIILEF